MPLGPVLSGGDGILYGEGDLVRSPQSRLESPIALLSGPDAIVAHTFSAGCVV
jgi:hypothetical protein